MPACRHSVESDPAFLTSRRKNVAIEACASVSFTPPQENPFDLAITYERGRNRQDLNIEDRLTQWLTTNF